MATFSTRYEDMFDVEKGKSGGQVGLGIKPELLPKGGYFAFAGSGEGGAATNMPNFKGVNIPQQMNPINPSIPVDAQAPAIARPGLNIPGAIPSQQALPDRPAPDWGSIEAVAQGDALSRTMQAPAMSMEEQLKRDPLSEAYGPKLSPMESIKRGQQLRGEGMVGGAAGYQAGRRKIAGEAGEMGALKSAAGEAQAAKAAGEAKAKQKGAEAAAVAEGTEAVKNRLADEAFKRKLKLGEVAETNRRERFTNESAFKAHQAELQKEWDRAKMEMTQEGQLRAMSFGAELKADEAKKEGKQLFTPEYNAKLDDSLKEIGVKDTNKRQEMILEQNMRLGLEEIKDLSAMGTPDAMSKAEQKRGELSRKIREFSQSTMPKPETAPSVSPEEMEKINRIASDPEETAKAKGPAAYKTWKKAKIKQKLLTKNEDKELENEVLQELGLPIKK